MWKFLGTGILKNLHEARILHGKSGYLELVSENVRMGPAGPARGEGWLLGRSDGAGLARDDTGPLPPIPSIYLT